MNEHAGLGCSDAIAVLHNLGRPQSYLLDHLPHAMTLFRSRFFRKNPDYQLLPARVSIEMSEHVGDLAE